MENLVTLKLETERLILRKFTLDDAVGMYNNWASDILVNKYLGWSLHESVEETKEILVVG